MHHHQCSLHFQSPCVSAHLHPKKSHLESPNLKCNKNLTCSCGTEVTHSAKANHFSLQILFRHCVKISTCNRPCNGITALSSSDSVAIRTKPSSLPSRSIMSERGTFGTLNFEVPRESSAPKSAFCFSAQFTHLDVYIYKYILLNVKKKKWRPEGLFQNQQKMASYTHSIARGREWG